MLFKRLHVRRYEQYLVLIVVLATLFRLFLISFDWPTTNSDEGNMGIVGLHVAFKGEWPIWFYGLPYLGPLEGYTAAPLFRLFGPSLFTLRLGLLPFFPLFLVCMYYLSRLLFSERMALFTVFVLACGSSDIVSRQLKAVGEYPELLCFAAAISLMSVWLALTYSSREMTMQLRRRRQLVYLLLGLVIGVATWVDFLILPFVMMAGLLLLVFCWRELRSWSVVLLLLGAVIGAFPLLLYNFTAPLDRNSLSVHLSLVSAGKSEFAAMPDGQWRRLSGLFFISLPFATGANPRCDITAFPYFGTSASATPSCMLLHGGWSVGVIGLWLLATLSGCWIVWRMWRSQAWRRDGALETRQELLRQCGRLVLLLSAGLTFLLYATSPSAAVVPVTSSRYLTCLLVATPAVLWPLWQRFGLLRTMKEGWGRIIAVLSGAGLVLVLLMFLIGSIRIPGEIPMAQATVARQNALVQFLLQHKATRIYSEYWTCNNLTFQTREEIICSSLDEQLGPGFDRYHPYADIVRAAPQPAYVFPIDSRQAASFAQQRGSGSRDGYQPQVVEGYVIYLPE